MMELRGFTAVDSVYEFFGYAVADTLYGSLSAIHLPAMLAIAGFCIVFWRATERGSWGQLAGYLVYLIVALFLTSPIAVNVGPPLLGSDADRHEIRTVRAPRFLSYAHVLMDNLVRVGVVRSGSDMEAVAHHWVRLSAATHEARILDAPLRQRFARFVADVFLPAIARLPATDSSVVPLHETGDVLAQYDDAARVERDALLDELRRHVRTNWHHMSVMDDRPGGGWRQDHEAFYVRQMAWNETYRLTDATEMALIDKAVPPYHWYDTSQNTHGHAEDRSFGMTLWHGFKSILAWGLRGIGAIGDWVDQQASGPILYYRITLYAPYIYGLVLMLLLAAWPIPALWTLWPGGADRHPFNFGPLLNYLKVLLSVKLWPLFWAMLAGFNTARQWLPGTDAEDTQGGELYHAFSAIAAMYILVPAISFLLVQLASRAGSMAVANFGGMGAPGAAGLGGLVHQGEMKAGQVGIEKGMGVIRTLTGSGGGGGGAPGGSAGAGGGAGGGGAAPATPPPVA